MKKKGLYNKRKVGDEGNRSTFLTNASENQDL